ncbi:hypothetical protein DH09_21085 [Bacillaceae bacterium JMAK1]|nr:hypothetical protein DH09_21085 [Bacillaceae bacterium JMAK1]
MAREKYFVTVNQGSLELSPVKVDDNTIQYEVFVNSEEKHELEHELSVIDLHDVEGDEIVTFFDEKQADRDKEEVGKEFGRLYKLIYQYGSKETQSALDEISK